MWITSRHNDVKGLKKKIALCLTHTDAMFLVLRVEPTRLLLRSEEGSSGSQKLQVNTARAKVQRKEAVSGV